MNSRVQNQVSGMVATVYFKLGAASRRDALRLRADRMARLRGHVVDERFVAQYISRYGNYTREQLMAAGMLSAHAPQRGLAAISPAHRTAEGERLLQQARDLLFALLFGGPECGVDLDRTERELLTLAVPRAKAEALEFMQDSAVVSHDSRADNTIIEVEYGEVRSEFVGDGILAALRMINLLEVNEQILYARMTNVEQRSLRN